MTGKVAFGLSSLAILLMGSAFVQSLGWAWDGAWALPFAPALGLAMAIGVFAGLRRVCRTGSRKADRLAFGLIVLMLVVSVLGVSFGGFMLVVPAAFLLAAYAITPVPR